MRWKCWGFFPVIKADGAEIARAAAGAASMRRPILASGRSADKEVSWRSPGGSMTITVAIFDAMVEHASSDL